MTRSRTLLLAMAVVLGTGCAASDAPETDSPSSTVAEQPRFDPSLSDPRAIEIAEKTLDAMGGREGFERTAYLTFHFVVKQEGGEVISDYAHYWDRRTDRYRLDGRLKDGREFQSFFQFRPLQGKVFVKNREVDPIGVPDFLRRFYSRFINDSYWLLMPMKMLDPGVILKYEGETTDETGEIYDIVHLSFLRGTGLTWQDQYWAFVNRKTGLMDRWEYVLTGSPPDKRQIALWADWKQFGPLVLSTEKTIPDQPYQINFTDVEARETVPEEIFTPPS